MRRPPRMRLASRPALSVVRTPFNASPLVPAGPSSLAVQYVSSTVVLSCAMLPLEVPPSCEKSMGNERDGVIPGLVGSVEPLLWFSVLYARQIRASPRAPPRWPFPRRHSRTSASATGLRPVVRPGSAGLGRLLRLRLAAALLPTPRWNSSRQPPTEPVAAPTRSTNVTYFAALPGPPQAVSVHYSTAQGPREDQITKVDTAHALSSGSANTSAGGAPQRPCIPSHAPRRRQRAARL